tara:strand:+ start:19375 stop:19908 length:534 start_codon:yes stop_codon:yes gene_type:complete
MKQVLFINSHLGSGADELMSALSKNQRIQRFKGFAPFNHPDDLAKLTDKRHKCDNAAGIYMHGLWNNSHWVRAPVRKVTQFIHLIREPRASLFETGGKPKDALYGYCYRLSGIYEMVQRTPESLVFDMDNLDLEVIQKTLDIDSIEFNLESREDTFPEDLCKLAEKTYERYFKLLGL